MDHRAQPGRRSDMKLGMPVRNVLCALAIAIPLLLLPAGFQLATAQEPSDDAGSNPVSDISYSFPDSIPFGVGERLRYHMDFAFVRAGLSEMMLLGVDSTTSQPAFHFRSRVRSTSGIDLVYKVRDVVQSWFDMDSLYSVRFEKDIREGSFRSRKYLDYNHHTQWASISNEFGPKGVTAIEQWTHNIISALYWVRTQPLEKGKDLRIPLHDIDKQYPMVVRVYGRETVEVPAGRYECWKVEPMVESEGLFKQAGRLWVWLSDDEHRIPVKMNSKIPVGVIEGKLVDYQPPFTPEELQTWSEDLAPDDWDW
ncbi:DUF3108 domain-containing protein [bacterium]|nr:DUF3108 domain-containing protein [bacterium]